MLPSIPPECADLITSRDRPPIVEETLVTVNKSTTVKSCTSKQNTCKLPLLLGGAGIHINSHADMFLYGILSALNSPAPSQTDLVEVRRYLQALAQ